MNLIIGAGDRHKEGWIHHDVLPLEGIDIQCEFKDLPRHVEDGSCDKIELTHVLEHFPMKETVDVLKTINKMLKPGGELYIEVPNLYWHAEMIIQDPTNRQIVQYAYGGQKDKWDFHFNGFTPHTLLEDLESAGFIMKEINPASSIECLAQKSLS